METSLTKTTNRVESVKIYEMNCENKLKILLLGPVSVSSVIFTAVILLANVTVKTGKTAIANFLSDSTENSIGENVRPTKGVRIVEFVVPGLRTKSVYQKEVEVELWDCSGDDRYRSCWPAMLQKANGIIFVYSEASNGQKSSLQELYDFFVKQSNFPKGNCSIVKNQLTAEDAGGRDLEENPLPNLNFATVNLEGKGSDFKKYFNSFLSAILKSSSID